MRTFEAMTVENARLFMNRAASDPSLRDQLNEATSLEAIRAVLAEQGLAFTYAEFNEAFTGILANSQSPEEASVVREIKTWWELLLASIDQ